MKRTLLSLLVALTLLTGLMPAVLAEDAGEPVPLHLMLNVVANEIDMTRSNLVELQKRTNTAITVEIPPYSNYGERVRLLIVSGSKLPDAIRNVPADMRLDLMEMGTTVPLEDYVYNAPNLMYYFDQYPGYLTALTTPEGHLMALPIMGYNRGLGGTYLRLDWLENLGLTGLMDIEACSITLEDFETIMRAFTFDDPDGNGENDTYGFGMPAGSAWTTYVPNVIQGAFDTGYGMKLGDDGRYYDATLEDQWDSYLAAARYFKGLIDEGVVDPEAFTLSREQFRERWYKGKVGTAFTFGSDNSYASFYPAMVEIEPNVQLTWLQSLVGDGGQYKTYLNGLVGAGSGWFVTKDCENVEAFINLADYSASEEGGWLVEIGMEGDHYELVDGSPEMTTQAHRDAYNAYRQGALHFISVESFAERVQVSYLQFDADIREKLLGFRLSETSSFIVNDSLNLVIPTYDRIDRYNEYENTLSQEVLKYLTTPGIDESGMQSARDAFIGSREYGEYWLLVTETYQATIGQ